MYGCLNLRLIIIVALSIKKYHLFRRDFISQYMSPWNNLKQSYKYFTAVGIHPALIQVCIYLPGNRNTKVQQGYHSHQKLGFS